MKGQTRFISFGFGLLLAACSVAQNPTVTPLPTLATPVSVANNADWTPVGQDFDGVMMVRVPAGCFMMGSTDAQITDLTKQDNLQAIRWKAEGPQSKIYPDC